MLTVNEIFYSIQGEGAHAGLPCVFIRLTYCNLRCSYCDTEYAFYEGKEYSIERLIDETEKFNCNLIELTGGEPLLQNEANPLMTRLCGAGKTVLLETGGSLSIKDVDKRVCIIMDLKTPSSKMEKKNLYENILFLKPDDEVKFVIGDRNDYEWTKEKIKEYKIDRKANVLISPVFGKLEPEEIVDWILEDNLNARFQLQTHKYIWEPDKRGV
ncbi:MAG: radical SAM protein [Chlorobi bacterium]|nr:radical SAM protein [Chlorobiota bacterium]